VPLFQDSLALLESRFPEAVHPGAIIVNLASGFGELEEREALSQGLQIIHVDYEESHKAMRERDGFSTENFIVGNLYKPSDVVMRLRDIGVQPGQTGACLLINPTDDSKVIKGSMVVATTFGFPLVIKSDHGASQRVIAQEPSLIRVDKITWVLGNFTAN